MSDTEHSDDNIIVSIGKIERMDESKMNVPPNEMEKKEKKKITVHRSRSLPQEVTVPLKFRQTVESAASQQTDSHDRQRSRSRSSAQRNAAHRNGNKYVAESSKRKHESGKLHQVNKNRAKRLQKKRRKKRNWK